MLLETCDSWGCTEMDWHTLKNNKIFLITMSMSGRVFRRILNLFAFRRHCSRPQTAFVCDGDPNKRKMSPQQPLKHRIMVNYHVIIILYKQKPFIRRKPLPSILTTCRVPWFGVRFEKFILPSSGESGACSFRPLLPLTGVAVLGNGTALFGWMTAATLYCDVPLYTSL